MKNLCEERRNMSREIYVPNLNSNLLKFAIQNNNNVLLSFCKSRLPKYGEITSYGIMWETFEEFQRDAEETCHYFYQLYVFTYDNTVYAPSHSYEIYVQKVNPYTLQPLN